MNTKRVIGMIVPVVVCAFSLSADEFIESLVAAQRDLSVLRGLLGEVTPAPTPGGKPERIVPSILTPEQLAALSPEKKAQSDKLFIEALHLIARTEAPSLREYKDFIHDVLHKLRMNEVFYKRAELDALLGTTAFPASLSGLIEAHLTIKEEKELAAFYETQDRKTRSGVVLAVYKEPSKRYTEAFTDLRNAFKLALFNGELLQSPAEVQNIRTIILTILSSQRVVAKAPTKEAMDRSNDYLIDVFVQMQETIISPANRDKSKDEVRRLCARYLDWLRINPGFIAFPSMLLPKADPLLYLFMDQYDHTKKIGVMKRVLLIGISQHLYGALKDQDAFIEALENENPGQGGITPIAALLGT